QAYRDAKANIVRHQSSEDWAVLNAEQAWVSSMAEDTPSQVRYYSTQPFPTENQKGVWLDAEGNISTSHADRPIAHTSDIALRGTHNVKNVLAALSVANILNIPSDVQVQVLRTFRGLPNRLEVVCTHQDVTYINDTTSTMPEATLAALEVFSDQVVHLIAGGQSKDVSYQELIETIQTSSVRTIILLPGTVSELLQTHLRLAANQELHTVDDLQTAVTIAQQKANPNDVVLFSPAATSFASFKNEFDRGETFRQAVHTLT
ncbi:MAG: glutamate ligase domain-containing protein, partial [Candidatus Paceibacteria bacterium]